MCTLGAVFKTSLAALAAALVVGIASHAEAARRVALVVGNSAYEHTARLPNARNDATDMAAVLRKLNFQVVEGLDLSKGAFDLKVREFAAALQGAEAGVLFYAGHGLQVGGQNYLVPIDTRLGTAEALEFEMVKLDDVHRIMERITNTNIIFLDACRDNPLARNLARAMGTRVQTRSGEIGRGLAAVESGVGTLISFSTQPGNVALDGSGRNSPFARALTKHVAASTDDLSAILIAVRNDVMKETGRRQIPWEHSALTGHFFFAAPRTAAPPAAPPPKAAGGGGSFLAVVSSVQSRESAEDTLLRVRTDAADRLRGKTVNLRETSILDKGTFYRVVVEPPTSRSDAQETCDELKKLGFGGCFLVSH